VLLTVHNEADFGRRGIQYVHYPAYRRPRPRDDVRWYHGPSLVLDAYYRLADILAKVSLDRVRQNLTLVNSDWTGEVFRDWHGVTPITVYPPVHTTFHDVAWEDRVDGFLCIGRVSPEKEIDRVIDIVSRLRLHRPHLTLRIIGTLGGDRYSREIARRVDTEGDWVSIDADLSREALLDLIPRYRYGIHGMLEEHFGMAPAEMVAAGCIVFVPNGGGQTEVVGREPRLTYRSLENAVDSIAYVLEHPTEQSALRARLATRVPLFSTERFVATIRQVVETFPYP
jgi:glycosyltransferase involved in cell wall biosynthesis